MAKEPAKLRANTPEVEQFITMTLTLIQAATAYASAPPDPDTNAMLREVQVVTAALQSALNTVSMQQGR